MKRYLLVLLSFFIMSCNSGNNDNEKKLIGIWQGNLKDDVSKEKIGIIIIEFTVDGKFIQKEFEKSSEVTYKEKYRAETNKIYLKGFDPKEEHPINYYFENEKLIIELDGVKNDYIKIK